MKVSYILPVFETGESIIKSLESIQNQAYENWEAIYVNDNGQDSTVEIIKTYSETDKRIKLINLSQNVGSGISRKYGFEFSSGEIICFIDPDDYIEPDILEKVVNKFNEDCAIDSVMTSVNFDDKDNTGYKPKLGTFVLEDKTFDQCQINDAVRRGFFSNALWPFYFKKELLENIKSFPGHSPSSDAPITMFMLSNARKMKIMSDVGYNYVINNGSVSVKKPDEQKIARLINNCDILLENLEHLGDKSEFCQYAFSMSQQAIIYNMYKGNASRENKENFRKFNKKYGNIKMPKKNINNLGAKLIVKLKIYRVI